MGGGLNRVLQKCNGMFAFALWDNKNRSLTLVRDRVGKKPLYYGWAGNDFVFGSELRALSAYPGFLGEINRDALALFLRYSYVPAPLSIYKNAYKLMPGAMLTILPGDISKRTSIESLNRKIEFYWSARQVVEKGIMQPFGGTEAEAEQALHELLKDAASSRMISDVPLGALLSGGIDSSTVVSLMQANNTRPIKTFTIGFSQKQHNEAEFAKAVAQHLGTDHTELYVTDREVLDVVPELASIYDEPFADSSQVPTYLISKLARTKLTVALTGDGGDELFCGYRRYFRGPLIWKASRALPKFLRHSAAMILKAFSRSPEDRLSKIAIDMMAENILDMYINRISAARRPELILKKGAEISTGFMEIAQGIDIPDVAQHMMFLDMINYLTDDILAKVDRASMAVSLELRNPILDYRVIEFAWQLPPYMKMDTKQGKLILKRVLERYIPTELIDRPKMGFGAPTSSWLPGPLKDWAEALLSEERLKTEGFFESEVVRGFWAGFLSKKYKYHHILWNILMFQAWNEKRNRDIPSSLIH